MPQDPEEDSESPMPGRPGTSSSIQLFTRSREDVVAILLLFLIPTLLFADLLFFGVQIYYGDLAPFYHPISTILRETVLSGEFPSWNPLWSGGQPLAANPNFYVFYPPRWLVMLPDFELGFRLHILVHIYLALAGSYFLFRDLQLGIPASFFGAFTFALSGFYLSFLKLPPIYFSLVWIPLIFVFARRLILKPSAGAFAAAALAWGMQLLAGEPTTIVQTGVLLGCFALYESWRPQHERTRRALRNLMLVGFLAVSAFLVGAVQMIPTADLSGDSIRARGLTWDDVRTWSMPPFRPLELIYPDLLGDGLLGWRYFAYPGKTYGYIDFFHLGGMAALLIIGAFVFRKPPAAAVALIAFLSFLFAAGSHTPILGFLYEHGVMRSTRYTEKFAMTGVLALTLLGVLFADRCLRRESGAIRSMVIASLGVAAVSALLAALSYTSIYPGMFTWLWGQAPSLFVEPIIEATRRDWSIAALSASAVAALFFWLRTHEPGPGWFALVLALLVIDIGLLANRNVQRVPEEFFDPPPLAKFVSTKQPFRIFHAATWGKKTLHPSWTLSAEAKSWINRNGMYPRLSASWGFHSVHEPDYDATHLLPTTDLNAALTVIQYETGDDRFSETILRMSNVAHVLEYSDEKERIILESPPDQLLISEVTPIAMRKIEGPVPRYYFADSIVRIATLRDFAERVKDQDRAGDLRNIAYVGFDPEPVGPGVVESVRESTSRVSLSVRADAPAYLVISITPHKYWRATVNGAPAQLHVTNVGYQGMKIPAGRHDVELVYRNPLILIGAIISTLSVLSLTAILIVTRGRSGTAPAAA